MRSCRSSAGTIVCPQVKFARKNGLLKPVAIHHFCDTQPYDHVVCTPTLQCIKLFPTHGFSLPVTQAPLDANGMLHCLLNCLIGKNGTYIA